MIIEHLPRWIITSLPIVGLLLIGILVEKHYVSRISCFTNSLAITIHSVTRAPTNEILLIYTEIGVVLGVYGLLAYIAEESLSEWYYDVSFLLYASLPVGAVILLPTPFIPTLVVGGILNVLIGSALDEEGIVVIYREELPGETANFLESHVADAVDKGDEMWVLLRD